MANHGGLTNQPKNYLYPLPLLLTSLKEVPLEEVFAFELLREGALDLFTVLWLAVSLLGACVVFLVTDLLLLFDEVVRVCCF